MESLELEKFFNGMGCEHCMNCIPIGEGDHICDEMDEPTIVIEDYSPTNDYMACNGTCFEHN